MEQLQGMEIHIRNVPAQATENALRNFLKPYFHQLSIFNVHCQKPRDKPYAQLTFLNIDNARRFLEYHGQVREVGNRRSVKASLKAINLKFLGQPIYCERSNRDANPYLLRVLAREAEERKSQALVPFNHAKPKIFPVTFQSTSVCCGAWAYVNSELVFSPQLEWVVDGTVKFGERVMILTLDDGRRVDFRYTSTLEIVMEDGSTPSLIFSVHEPPRFFEKITTDPIVELFAKLGLDNLQQGQRQTTRKTGPNRHRLPVLDDKHKPIARCCLVYRIALARVQFSPFGLLMDVREGMSQLRQAARQLPPMSDRRTDIHIFPSYADGLKLLHRELSSPSCEIPFVLKFQVQRLAQDGYLSPFTVLTLLPEFTALANRSEISVCVDATRKLFHQISFPGPETEASEFDPDTILGILLENEAQCKREGKYLAVELARRSQNIAIIHRAKVMPSGIQVYGPEPESNNRILRKYPGQHENFLRVQFCDEDGLPVRFNPRISNDKIYHGRFKEVLRDGINIAGRVFKFLGFSHSSLRAQSCWFMAPFLHEGSLLFDRMLIQSLGDFRSIRSPAKCAARIGQAFSDTRTAVTIDHARSVYALPDVENEGRVFSDGVGTISMSMAKRICERLSKQILPKPTCFQIRYRGAKGMISVDSRLPGEVLVLRPSMIKFSGSNSSDIEICEAAYRPLPMYLNRQFIKILEDMGVDDNFFLDLQAREVERLRNITDNPLNASVFLKRQSVGDSIHFPWLITALAMRNLDFRADGFLRDTVELTLLAELRKLKHKTRIPVEKGYHLHGLMDETGYLREGEIFCSVVEDGIPKYITGKDLIVSRAPALHPGDVQLAEGVMPPKGSPLLDIHNCICFSQYGTRDLPSKLSGGDLDGDRYYIMWDEKAKTNTTFKPAEYPIQQPVDIGRLVEVDDMTDFFVQFMESDQLGRIAVQHRIIADQKEEGVTHPSCILLSEMHSTAVDFSKTGIPVDMSRLPRGNPWRPDFEAPGPHVTIEKNDGIVFESKKFRDPLEEEDEDDEFTNYRYYESNKVLGKLYRAIDEQKIFTEIQNRSAAHGASSRSTVIDEIWKYVQKKVRGFQWEDQKEWAWDIRDMYEEALLNTMTDYSQHPQRPLSELEAFTGNILGKTGAPNPHQRELSKTMKEKFDEDAAFIVNCILKDGDELSEERLVRSVACLAVSLEEDQHFYQRRERLLSFKYLAAAVCLKEVEKLPGWEDLEHLTLFEKGAGQLALT
ncbi:RNA-dependent RNA polymerase [Lachnellula suecica]|uniref:RNA-dependent RNA polymerase n=1 Tax=Lachnellula suecica TaxID=602035 RepID=A0A8T9CB64_9HELO|nr:RNA-dependent RNA polymerase [Lachnellula suecica]